MNTKVTSLALAVRHSLAIMGGTTLLLLSAHDALADDAVAAPAAPAATTATAPASPATPVADGSTASPEQPSSHQLGAVVVTAQRRAEKIQDVPSAVVAVGGNTILDESAGSSAANVLTRAVPNASAASPTPTRPRWWIRGVGTGAQGYDVQSPVGIYFDDVYFSNANATGQPIFDLNRVEVLEGPQGTLWGKNTTGGAVNFVSTKPSFTTSGYAKLDESSHDDQLFEAAYGGAVNDWLAARASFHGESGAGAFKNAADGSKGPQFHDDAGRVQFLASISPDLTALLNVHFRDYSSTGNSSSAEATGPNGLWTQPGAKPVIYASDDPTVAIGNAYANTQVRQDGAALTLTDQVGRNTLTSITGFEGFTTNGLSDGPTFYAPGKALEQSQSLSQGATHQLSEELRLASPRSDRDNWVVGTMLFLEDISSHAISAVLPNAVTGVTPSSVAPSWAQTDLAQNTTSYSLFGSNTFNFTPTFNVTAGLRYTTETKKDNYQRLGASGLKGKTDTVPYTDPATWWLQSSVDPSKISLLATQQADKTWGAWTYDLTPEWNVSDNARLYLRYAHGFRSGGFNTTALTQAAVNANGGVVNPEYLTSYELGAKSEWLDGQLIANGDVFYYDYNNIQVNVVRDIDNGLGGTTSTSILTNAAKGRANGVELNLEALPVDNLHLSLATAWLNTKYLDYTNGTPGTAAYADYSDNHFVRSPHLSQVFTADYRLPLQNGNAIVLATDWKYQSKQFYYGNDQIRPVYFQDGYTVGNARLSYVLGKVTLSAYVNNLTDKLYKIHSGTVSNTYQGNTVSWSTGRIFGASITCKF